MVSVWGGPRDEARVAMSTGLKVLKHELNNLRRSRWLWGYALFLLLLTDALLRFGGGGTRVVVSPTDEAPCPPMT